MFAKTLKKSIVLYLLCITMFLFLTNIFLFYNTYNQDSNTYAVSKIEYYRQHYNEYNVIYVGDSRTYCGMDPELLDKLLGTKSLNLATFAHWFPTQYPSFQDIVSFIPYKTIVVWSIGHQNFRQVHKIINTTYHIGFDNLFKYLRLGYSLN